MHKVLFAACLASVAAFAAGSASANDELNKMAQDPKGWAAHGHPEWGQFRLGKTNPNFSTSGPYSDIPITVQTCPAPRNPCTRLVGEDRIAVIAGGTSTCEQRIEKFVSSSCRACHTAIALPTIVRFGRPRRPQPRKISKVIAVTVDLPTPPFPLATASTCLIPGSDIFGGACIGGGMDVSLGFGKRTQRLERVDARIVAVGERRADRIVADRLDLGNGDVALAHLQRPDVARRLQQELRLAHTLGYSAAAAWWRVGWPQLLPRLAWPLLAVLAYGLTVVDVALLIGPTTPPTLAVLAWQWLQDADPATNAQGAAAAWLLAAMLALLAALAWGAYRAPWWRQRQTRGAPPLRATERAAGRMPALLAALLLAYGAVMLALLLGSVIGPWPFPQLWPHAFTWAAWQGVASSSATLWTTVWLALASSGAALLWAVAWLEWAPAHWQLRARPLLMLPLVLPAVLWVVGLHRLSLAWGLDTTGTGLWLAHTLAVLPYVLIALQGPYQGFDGRLRQVAATLGHGRWHFLLRVKWPLLRSALAASVAIGFAVSVAQYLPTLYVGAGRFATVTTEAVTLAAGGQRLAFGAESQGGHVVGVTIDRLTSRLIELTVVEGGEPPVAFAWIALGSAARHEQALSTAPTPLQARQVRATQLWTDTQWAKRETVSRAEGEKYCADQAVAPMLEDWLRFANVERRHL